MGYLCPVCEEPFGDAEACANHLAVTAILHGGPHETWLAKSIDDGESVDGYDAVDDDDAVDNGESVDDDDAVDGPEKATESETVDGWESVPRAKLTELVAERATETTDHDHPGDHTHPVGESHEQVTHDQATHEQPAIAESRAETAQLDAEAQQILGEARELTRKMQQRDLRGDGERKES